MALYAKNIAMMTDAQCEEVEILVRRLMEQGTIRIDVAELCHGLKTLAYVWEAIRGVPLAHRQRHPGA